jgi:hypothetical protein
MERMTIDNYQTVRVSSSVWIILFENEKERANTSQFPVMGNRFNLPQETEKVPPRH